MVNLRAGGVVILRLRLQMNCAQRAIM